ADLGGRVSLCGVAQTERAGAVESPAPKAVVAADSTGVHIPQLDTGPGGRGADLGGSVPGVRVAEPELTIVVPPPAPQGLIAAGPAGLKHSATHRGPHMPGLLTISLVAARW